ncbi:MAG: glycosyltransferase [Nakamurella sp.]
MQPDPREVAEPHSISVVIPVYQGERTLPALMSEIASLHQPFASPAGHSVQVTEVLLVHDNGPDGSAAVMRTLALRYEFVRVVWLSRNFGQHPATLAGMASSGGDWIVTMDEDGQHDPQMIGSMLDVAMGESADVVYGRATNTPPHGFLRNLASPSAKRLLRLSTHEINAESFHSYRLVLGEIGRSVAAYAGAGVYLDVALAWVGRKVATCPMEMSVGGGRPSGYSIRSLTSHFWRMVLSSGTRALRLVSLLGVAFAAGGCLLALYFLSAKLFWHLDAPAGWPSLITVLLLCSGAILFSLGVIAEYLGVAVNMAMGKPLYLIVSDPSVGPIGHRNDRPADR